MIELLQIVKITGLKITKKRLKRALLWQEYMDEDRPFYSVSENATLGVGNV